MSEQASPGSNKPIAVSPNMPPPPSPTKSPLSSPAASSKPSSNINTFILTAIFVVGFAISFWYTNMAEYVPMSLDDITAADDAIYVVVTKEKDILLPVSSYLDTRTSTMDVDIFFKTPNANEKSFRKMILSENNSNLITIKDIVNTTGRKLAKYDLLLSVRHPLQIINLTEKYNLDIFYRLANETMGDLRKLSIPLEWNVRSLDFSALNYFWIIFSGVLLSRVFSLPSAWATPDKWNPLGRREYLWIPFSAIITLLIFTSFHDQVRLSSDIILNFALAFGFGFGFDKVFESWQKAPRQ
jgi:hypothetical protein